MGNMPSFDMTYTCTNATKQEHYKSSSYKSDVARMAEFFDGFDHKAELSKISRQLLRNEAFFAVFRDEGQKFVFQELPPNRAKITGRWDRGILFSFDYYYFMEGGVDIEMFPPVFKKNLTKLIEGKLWHGTYAPANSIGLRGTQGYAQWVDCSPKDGFWAFKMTPEVIARIPFFVALFPDLVKENVIRELQNSSYMAAASKLIMGQVPMIEGKATVKDAISISPVLLGQFLALVKSAIDSDAVKVAASPLSDMKAFDFKSDPDIKSSYLRTTLDSSGVAANLLFSGDVKPNTIETMLSLNVDEILMKSIYPQFEEFLSWQVNQRTKKFKFKVKLEGTNFYLDSNRRRDVALEMMDRGIVMPQKIAASQGMSPFEMQRHMDEARANGWVDDLTPVLQAAQISKEDGAGRPKKSDEELGEAGAQTREDGGNEGK